MRPAIVLLHGFTQTGAAWDPVIAELGAGYRALAPDLRGHGTAARRPATLEGVVDDVRRLAPERFVLGGYSMGGRLALHVALTLPTRIAALVLIGASPGIADRDERRRRRAADERLADELEDSTIAAFARRWAAQPLFAGQPPDVAAGAHADRLRNEPAGLAAALRGLGTGALPSLWDRLGELTMPVALVVGERDARFRAIAERMAAAINVVQTVVVPGAGHAAGLEAPGMVAQVLRDVVAAASQQPSRQAPASPP